MSKRVMCTFSCRRESVESLHMTFGAFVMCDMRDARLTEVGAVLYEGVHLAPKHRHAQLGGRLQEPARRGQLADVEATHAVRAAQREGIVRRHVADRVAEPDIEHTQLFVGCRSIVSCFNIMCLPPRSMLS